MPHEGSTRAEILPACPSLDRSSRDWCVVLLGDYGLRSRRRNKWNNSIGGLKRPVRPLGNAQAHRRKISNSWKILYHRPTGLLLEAISSFVPFGMSYKSEEERRPRNGPVTQNLMGSRKTLTVPNCHAIRKKIEGWDTTRLSKPREEQSTCRGLQRSQDLGANTAGLLVILLSAVTFSTQHRTTES
ncbi:hypothetical protein CSKR_100086 [Clonorchis sinensis]|uniref:Uncharacterized protein n=1 Tax=Clonorchis sinensis TaxID=79923 RepID=A0A3R7JYL5_CLOSI|nr:hypothetical protein CSKR_100086 [Clonorchis sinensis]